MTETLPHGGDATETLAARVKERLGDAVVTLTVRLGEITVEVNREQLRRACQTLRDESIFGFEQLIDVCGVDYGAYKQEETGAPHAGPRFAVVYHLLSVKNNRRLRLRTFLDEDAPIVDSVVDLWPSANWYERETFDLFGIIFEGHPDLRRILTDYGFVGHPFRKDFPLIGQVEMRYDAEKGRVVYQPVSIEPRVNIPRVIREEGFAKG